MEREVGVYVIYPNHNASGEQSLEWHSHGVLASCCVIGVFVGIGGIV